MSSTDPSCHQPNIVACPKASAGQRATGLLVTMRLRNMYKGLSSSPGKPGNAYCFFWGVDATTRWQDLESKWPHYTNERARHYITLYMNIHMQPMTLMSVSNKVQQE